MVYIYVCKRFKVTMDMVSSREADWVNNLLQSYCKLARINGKLERAEINPKKRTNVVSFDSSTDVFKINMVYKDSKGEEHELKWVIKVTRSDASEIADALLRHERQVYSRLMGDLINTVKQKAAHRLEGSRLSFQDLLHTPEFIFEELAHQADLVRTVLVLDNLEEKNFCSLRPGPLNLCHMRTVIRTMAKFHAVSLAYKRTLFSTFTSQSAQVKASRSIDEIVMEGENKVLTGRQGLFARFPFLAQRLGTLRYLVENREAFLDMYHKFLSCFPDEDHLVDIFEYVRLSIDDILMLGEQPDGDSYEDSPLDAITLGMLEARSFLFRYEDDENKENDRKKKSSKLQRSQSERVKDRSSLDFATRFTRDHGFAPTSPGPPSPGPHSAPHHPSPGGMSPPVQPATPAVATVAKTKPSAPSSPATGRHRAGSGKAKKGQMPASPKCPKLETGGGAAKKNKFFQNVIGKSKDDEKVPITSRRSSRVQKERDPNQPPKSAALINAKYVTYGRVTRDLAMVFWTAAPSLVRRFYLIKMVECYVETLGITLGQLGIDTDSFGLKYQKVVEDFQKHVLYGFSVSVLIAMATTSPEELDAFYTARLMGQPNGQSLSAGGGRGRPDAPAANNNPQQGSDSNSRYLPLTEDRVSHLRDLMRDVGAYVESKDFEQGLPITNFERYHELWAMEEDADGEDEEENGFGEEEERSDCDDEDYESAEGD